MHQTASDETPSRAWGRLTTLVSSSPPNAPSSDEASRGDAIVLSDSSVEAEDLAVILRLRGFAVFDVPLALFESRVQSEEPRVVIVDIDQSGALEKVRRVRELPMGRRLEVFLLGDPLRAAELAGISLSDNVFERPIDVQRLVDRITQVASPGLDHSARGTTPPPMFANRASAPPPGDSVPPISEFPRAEDPLEGSGLFEEGGEMLFAGGLPTGTRLSPELAAAITAAEEKARAEIVEKGSQPTPSEDVDCVLPPDLLVQLDEPLDAADDMEGTGGLGNVLAALGSQGGTGSAVSLTPPPPGTSGTPLPADATRLPPDRKTPAPPPSEMAPLGIEDRPRGGTPALGVRVAELLGIRLEDARKAASRSPTELAPVGLAGARLVVPPTPIGLAALAPPMPVVPAASQTPTLSPPVRFREPRDLGIGRSLPSFDAPRPPTFDPRELGQRGSEPPSASTRSGASEIQTDRPPARAETSRASRRDSPMSRDGIEVSPAAQSVRSEERGPTRGVEGGWEPHGREGRAGELRPTDTRKDPDGRDGRPHDTRSLSAVFGPAEGFRPFARAIVARQTGILTLSTDQGARSIVLSDGDIVTAASDVADESLVSFLAFRGDLSHDAADRLRPKLPVSGRHAGAALIAQSHLAANDLWPVLRAHAEWLIGKALVSGPGSVNVDVDAKHRLRSEPSVFGGATGAEVFVEAARRVIAPDQALAILGGSKARVDRGKEASILAECALPEAEDALVRAAEGRTLDELVADHASIASVVLALSALGVLSVLAPAEGATPRGPAGLDPLDDEAIRAKVRAKLALVREGDYFALLGIPRAATSYEVKRAFLELRRSFEPTRLLTAGTRDLYEEVELVVSVFEEAFEVLRDGPRRERYRRAIEEGPPPA